MPKAVPTDAERKAAREKAMREFPGNPSLQELHFVRYLFELEWRSMTTSEILAEVLRAKRDLNLRGPAPGVSDSGNG